MCSAHIEKQKKKKRATTDYIYDQKNYHGFIVNVFYVNHFTRWKALSHFLSVYIVLFLIKWKQNNAVWVCTV